MTITIQKSVPEEIQIEVPGYFKIVPEFGAYKIYYKVLSDKDCLRFTMYEDETFFASNYSLKSEVVKAVSEGTPISEEEFSIAATECYTRFFMASQTGKDETEVTGFEEVMNGYVGINNP